MATAKRAPSPVTLTLTEDEACTLIAILRNIGGDPAKSRRKHSDAMSDALYAVIPDGVWDPASYETRGSITFRETE
ncbi:hypothetical protein ACPXB5_11415 [Micromonospora arida]|uniref:hypothetical protein n=1 Tax=Micromonospora arida TaxID=2203715 RepID=UPI003CEC0F79